VFGWEPQLATPRTPTPRYNAAMLQSTAGAMAGVAPEMPTALCGMGACGVVSCGSQPNTPLDATT